MISINDILYYKKEQDLLKKWTMDKPLFIQGSSGNGKSTLANLIFQEKNITINTINSSFIKKGKSTLDYITDTLGKKSISVMFSNNSVNGLIIDDLDVIDTQDNIISKVFLIIKDNDNSVSPIILICNDMFISSNVKKIKKLCYCISISKPSIQRMVSSCNLLLPDSVVSKCANKSQGDWSYFNRILSLTDITNNLDDKLNDIDQKDISYNITTQTELLLTKKMTLEQMYKNCSGDHSLLSLMAFTNVPEILTQNKLDSSKVYNNLRLFDIVEKSIDTEWSLLNVSILYGCIIPFSEISKLHIKKYKPNYTHVFSVSTSQMNHRKLLKKVNLYTGKSINVVSALLYHSLKNDIAYKKCKEMKLKEFTLNELQKIINVYHKPVSFTSGQKKILTGLLLH